MSRAASEMSSRCTSCAPLLYRFNDLTVYIRLILRTEQHSKLQYNKYRIYVYLKKKIEKY